MRWLISFQRAKYYKCREMGIHLGEYQYLITIENEDDRLPISPEESMDAWAEAMKIDANIFDVDN